MGTAGRSAARIGGLWPSTPGGLAGCAQRHPIRALDGVPMASAAVRVPALEHGLRLLPPLAPGRHLGMAARSVLRPSYGVSGSDRLRRSLSARTARLPT